MAHWMSEKLNDAERTSRAVEVSPGKMAAPWERGTCPSGRAFKFRWTWRPERGETIESGEPEGGCNCKKCCPEEGR